MVGARPFLRSSVLSTVSAVQRQCPLRSSVPQKCCPPSVPVPFLRASECCPPSVPAPFLRALESCPPPVPAPLFRASVLSAVSVCSVLRASVDRGQVHQPQAGRQRKTPDQLSEYDVLKLMFRHAHGC